MATTKDVTRTPSGRIKYRGETFPGFNKPKRTPSLSHSGQFLTHSKHQQELPLRDADCTGDDPGLSSVKNIVDTQT